MGILRDVDYLTRERDSSSEVLRSLEAVGSGEYGRLLRDASEAVA